MDAYLLKVVLKVLIMHLLRLVRLFEMLMTCLELLMMHSLEEIC